MMTRWPQKARERGAALITVLLITVLMTTISIALMDTATSGVLRASGRGATLQARYFALGAEKLATSVLTASIQASPNKTAQNAPWASQNGRFDVGSGFIDARISDAGNCFNLNSLVKNDESTGLVADDTMIAQFKLILGSLAIDDIIAEGLADAIIDWIDSDSQPRNFGAEDFDYLERIVPHRAANSFMLDKSELLAIQGMTSTLYASISPLVCARPTPDASVYNVNTLTPEQAPLLLSLTEGRMAPDIAAGLLASTPLEGYASLQDFLALPPFADAGLATGAESQVAIKTRYYELSAAVVFGDALVQLESLFDAGAEGGLTLIARRFGEEF